MFGRATITLGIGPHSSYIICLNMLHSNIFCRQMSDSFLPKVPECCPERFVAQMIIDHLYYK